MEENHMRCLKPNGVYTTTAWRYFYANCPATNRLCSGSSGAYVAAITICTQRLWGTGYASA